jgi:2-haloacid dehalogenase
MSEPAHTSDREPVQGVLIDLLMAVMDSLAVWTRAAGDSRRGLAWRDAVTARMVAHPSYEPYEDLVVTAAREVGLPVTAPSDLFGYWPQMLPRPDAPSLARLTVPYAFVTNCSHRLAEIATRESGLRPLFTLSAEEAGWYKPDTRIYQEARRRLGSPPEHTLFVAGSTYDSEGANQAGLQACLVTRRPDQPGAGGHIVAVRSLEKIVGELERETRPSGR